MSDCIDQNIGKLMHEYELGILSDDDANLFGEHLLECEYCLNEVKSFREYAATVRQSEAVQDLINQPIEKSSRQDSFMKILWRRLWPETPFVFRPAIAYLLVLLMIVPAYFGVVFMASRKNEIRPVQTINLTSTRTPPNNVLMIGSGSDGIIRFEYPDAVPGRSYQVIITSEKGEEIARYDNFDSFDDLKTGEIFFPHHLMSPGKYRLTISDPTVENIPDQGYGYRFKITE